MRKVGVSYDASTFSYIRFYMDNSRIFSNFASEFNKIGK